MASRIGWSAGLLGLVIWQGPALAQSLFPVPEPNIIVIQAEALGYGDIGCYGQREIRTPYLDKLAAQGVRFTDYYAGSPGGPASQGTLMAGRFPDRLTLPLSSNEPTVALSLRKAGYATCALGTWFIGGPGTNGAPNQEGFQEWCGYLDPDRAGNRYPSYLWRNDYKFSFPLNDHGKKGIYAPGLFGRAALNFIRLHKDGPFFLYLAMPLPGASLEGPTNALYQNRPWPEAAKKYASLVSQLDDVVGYVMILLHRLSLDETTVIFFTSDGGANYPGNDLRLFRSNGRFRGYRGDLYEGGLRVPMIVRWTGRIPAGRKIHQPWAAWDLFATIADIAGVKVPVGVDGESVTPLLYGDGRVRSSRFYWSENGGTTQAVRLKDWKAIRPNRTNSWELYCLKSDPAESRNVAAQHPAVVQKIEKWVRQRTDAAHRSGN